MSSLVISVLCVLPFLCTHCQAQEFPYVSFNGETYTNHSYLDLTLVGNMAQIGFSVTPVLNFAALQDRVSLEETGISPVDHNCLL